MKKVIILAVLLAPVCIKAQTKISFGPKAGVNFSVWTGKGSQGAAFKTGYYAGGFAAIPVTPHFTIQPELLYSSEGTDHNVTRFTDQYLKLPLMLQYRHESGFYAETGPQLAWLFSSIGERKNGEPDIDAKELRSPLATSIAFGLGWQLKAGIGFSFRYSAGISQLGDGSEVRPAVASLGAFYAF